MSKELEGKNIFVTGGSRDIGASIVDHLLDAGANVDFCYHHSSQEQHLLEKYSSKNGGVGTEINLLPENNFVDYVKADLKNADGREDIYRFLESLNGRNWDNLVLNASDSSLELNVDANLALVNKFLENNVKNIILLQSVPGHFYSRLSKSWMPKFYDPIAKAKNIGERKITSLEKKLKQSEVNFSIVCPPAVIDTTNWEQFKKHRDRDIDIKHKKITDALGLPTEVTSDDVGKKVTELIANPPRFGSVEYFNGTKDGKVYLADIYGPSLRLLDTFNVEQKSAWMIITKKYCKDHFVGNPILPGFLIEEAAAQSAALITSDGDFGTDLPILTSRSVDNFQSRAVPGDILKFQMEDYEITRRRFSGKVIVTNNESLVTEVFIKGAFFPRRFLK